MINVAREAILADLKARYKAGDKTVRPMALCDSHRWFRPQSNYYSGHGVIKCPVCNDGGLSYSRSAYNGHVRASCTKPNCVRWQE